MHQVQKMKARIEWHYSDGTSQVTLKVQPVRVGTSAVGCMAWVAMWGRRDCF